MNTLEKLVSKESAQGLVKEEFNSNKFSINQYKFIFFAIGIIINLLSSIIWNSLPLFFFNLLLLLSTAIFIRERNGYKYYSICFVSFSLILLLSYFGWIEISGTPYLIGGSDDVVTEQRADYVLDKYGSYNFTSSTQFYSNDRLYIYIITLIMKFSRIFGKYSTLMPRMLNLYIIIWTIALLRKILIERYFFCIKEVNKATLIFSLNPYYLYISSFVCRDTLAVFFELLVIYFFHRVLNRKRLNTLNGLFSIVLIFFVIFLTFYLRSSQVIIVIAIMAIMIIFNKNRKKINVRIVIIISILALMVISLDSQYNIFGIFETSRIYTDYQVDRGGLSSTIIGIRIFPIGWLLRYLYGAIFPFPSFITLFRNPNYFLIDLVMLWVYLFGLYQFCKLPSVYKNAANNPELFLIFIINFSAFTLMTLTFRHWLYMNPFLISLISKSNINGNANKKDKILMIVMFCAYLSIQALYIAIKA